MFINFCTHRMIRFVSNFYKQMTYLNTKHKEKVLVAKVKVGCTPSLDEIDLVNGLKSGMQT